MGSSGTLRRFVTTALLVAIGIFRGTLILAGIAIQVLLKGKGFLEPKQRTEEPECLKDPELGTHEFVTLGDVTLHYVSAGSHDKPLVLFLHGFPDFWFAWKHQILGLKRDFWVVVPDLRGYGQSSKPSRVEDYQGSYLMEDVERLIKSLGKTKATIVGHDWGASIAWSFATKHEDMVEKLVIINGPHPLAIKHQLEHSLQQIFMSWYFVAFQAPWLPEVFMRVSDLEALDKVHAPYDQEEREAFKYAFCKPGAFTGPINYYRAAFRKVPRARYHKFRKLGVPALILWGRRDFALSSDLAMLSLEYAGSGRVEYAPNAGHWVHREDPDFVNQHIRRFVLTSEN